MRVNAYIYLEARPPDTMDSMPDQHLAEDEREKRLKGKEMRNQLPRVEVAAWDCRLEANEDGTLHI